MKHLKMLRERRKMSAAKLAAEMGVSQQAVSKWERGEAMPRAEILPKLADLLDCTVDALYGRDQNSA